MTQSLIARRFLGLNSAFSALNGAVLLVAAGFLSPALLIDPVDWAPLGLRLLGVGLVGFAVLLFILAKNRFVSKATVNEIVVLDALWVVGSFVIVVFFGHMLTAMGTWLIIIVAIVVALFAVAQFAGAVKIAKPLPVANVNSKDGILTATVTRSVNAPLQVVWDVMTDHPAYADVASNIAKVEVLSGDGLGMKRRCFGPEGENWQETCDFFVPRQAYGFQIHTEADDYPYPISELSGKWSVKPLDTGAEFCIQITAKPKGNLLTRFIFSVVAKQQFKAVLIDLADAWAARMEREAMSNVTTA